MARRDVNKAYYLRKKLDGLSDEEKINTIKELELEDQLSFWMAEMLKAYKDKKLGTKS